MSAKRYFRFLIPGMGGILFVLLFVVLGMKQAASVRASVDSSTRYVSTSGTDAGNDCTVSSNPCRTIGRSIVVAQAGDEVHVAGGTYTDVTYDPSVAMGVTATMVITKDILSILGGYSPDFSFRNLDDYETIVDVSDSAGAFTAVFNYVNTTLDGFTLTGVRGAFPRDPNFVYFGGAIRVWGGAPTISNNILKNNVANGRGGGLYFSSEATPAIFGNTIFSNTTVGNGSGGGGIYASSGPATIFDNTIISNSADTEGGGIYVGWNVTATIFTNVIAYNQVISPTLGHGAGIRASGDGSNVKIIDNDIFGNRSQIGGSAIHVDGPVAIARNYIHDNQINSTPGLWGSAVYLGAASQPVMLRNNIIAHNFGDGVSVDQNLELYAINNTIVGNIYLKPDSPGNGLVTGSSSENSPSIYQSILYNNISVNNSACGIVVWGDVSADIDYNDVYNNVEDYCDLAAPGPHDISADPMFVDPLNADYHLLPGSPAINAGDSTYAPPIDFDGVKRPQGIAVDMGAFEFIFKQIFLPLTLK